MIVEWFLDLVMGVVEWFLGLFDPLDIPEFLTAPTSDMASFVSNFNSMGVWVPWTLMGVVVSAVVLTYGVTFGIKIVKQVIAHVPAFGGAG